MLVSPGIKIQYVVDNLSFDDFEEAENHARKVLLDRLFKSKLPMGEPFDICKILDVLVGHKKEVMEILE